MEKLPEELCSAIFARYLLLAEQRRKLWDYGFLLESERDESRAETAELSRLLEKIQQDLHRHIAEVKDLNEQLIEQRLQYGILEKEHGSLKFYLVKLEEEKEGWGREHQLLLEVNSDYAATISTQGAEIGKLAGLVKNFELLQAESEKEHKKICALLEHKDELIETQSVEHEKLCRLLAQKDELIETQSVEHEKLCRLLAQKDELMERQSAEHEKVCDLLKQNSALIETQSAEHEKLCRLIEQKNVIIQDQTEEHDRLCCFLSDRDGIIKNQNLEHERLCSIIGEQERIISEQQQAHLTLIEYVETLKAEREILVSERQEFMEDRDRVRGELFYIQSKLPYRLWRSLKKIIGR